MFVERPEVSIDLSTPTDAQFLQAMLEEYYKEGLNAGMDQDEAQMYALEMCKPNTKSS